MLNFIKKHSYWNFDLGSILIIFSTLLVLPFIPMLPEKYGYENGLIENLQMIVLIVGIYFCCTAKEYKKLFIFGALVISVLLLRETNCGRTIFFAIEGKENSFYKWKDLKYGYLAHPIFGFYITMILIYFLKNKLYRDVFKIIKKFRFPLLSILCLLFSAFLGMYAEKRMHNFVAEEFAEFLFYTFFIQILWLYSRQKTKKIS